MLVKRLQAAQTALKEAASKAKDTEEKKQISEAQRHVEALLKDALDAANRSKKTKEADAGESDAEADESETETESEEDGGDDTDTPAPGHTMKKTVTVTKKHSKDASHDAEDDGESEEDESEESETESETYEANRLAVKHLIAESGLEPELFDVSDMAKRGLKEARREIARTKRVAEAWTKRALKAVGDVSPAHAAKLHESGKSGGKSNTDLFAGCYH